MGLYTLIVGILKYCFVFWDFVRFDFYPWGFCLVVLLSIGFFSVPPHDHINKMGNVHTCIT